MPPRRESNFESLMKMPWWVGIMVGIAGYAVIAYGIPTVLNRGPMLSGVKVDLTSFAFLWLGICCFAGAMNALRGYLVGRKFDSQLNHAEDVRNLSWAQFEVMVGEAFRRQGYSVTENGGGGADDGIDLVLRKDGKKYYVQCKHWKVYSVGVTYIRELFGVIAANRADGGFFVTSGVYTKEALAFASNTSIKLLDGPALVKLIADVKSLPTPFALSCPTWMWGMASMYGTLIGPSKGSEIAADSAIRSPQELTISPPPHLPPVCRVCGSPMVKRTAKRDGSQFWGCSSYAKTKCGGTRQIEP